MSKIINTLKKGTGKARLVVVMAILAGVAALAFIGLAIALKQLLYFFGTVICAFITMSLKQTLDVYEYQGNLYADENLTDKKTGEAEEEPEDETEESEDESAEPEEESEETESEELPEYSSEEADGTDVASLLDKMNNLLDAAESGYDDEDMDEITDMIAESEEKGESKEDKAEGKKHKEKKHKERKHKLTDKLKKKKENAEETAKAPKTPDKGVIQGEILEDELEKDLKFLKQNISGDYAAEKEKEDEKEDEKSKKLVVVKPVSEEVAATYDKKKIKHTMHKYKVKRDHRLIMIDHCDKYYIKQTPAYIWVSDKEFNILLIEEEPRHLVLPLYGIKEITYLKKYPVNSDTDYPLFHKKSLLTDTFRPYLPDYTQSTVVTDLTSYKNLYGFGPGIYCTNRSAKNLFDLLEVEFRVDDKVTTSNKVNIYFKECYKAGILLRDDVIDANGYADRISHTLDDMAKSTVSNNEFRDTLNLLVRNKIITKEFSNHYMDVRNNMARS